MLCGNVHPMGNMTSPSKPRSPPGSHCVFHSVHGLGTKTKVPRQTCFCGSSREDPKCSIWHYIEHRFSSVFLSAMHSWGRTEAEQQNKMVKARASCQHAKLCNELIMTQFLGHFQASNLTLPVDLHRDWHSLSLKCRHIHIPQWHPSSPWKSLRHQNRISVLKTGPGSLWHMVDHHWYHGCMPSRPDLSSNLHSVVLSLDVNFAGTIRTKGIACFLAVEI